MNRPPSRSLIQFMSVILPIFSLSLVAKAARDHSCKSLINVGTNSKFLWQIRKSKVYARTHAHTFTHTHTHIHTHSRCLLALTYSPCVVSIGPFLHTRLPAWTGQKLCGMQGCSGAFRNITLGNTCSPGAERRAVGSAATVVQNSLSEQGKTGGNILMGNII